MTCQHPASDSFTDQQDPQTMPAPLRADWKWIAACMVLAALITLPFLPAVTYFYEDSYIYLSLAESITQGKYWFYNAPSQKYQPGYPLAVSLVRLSSLFHISSVMAGKLVCVIVRILLIPLIYILAYRLAGRNAGRLAAVFATVHAYSILYGVLIYSEPLGSLWILLSLVLMMNGRDPAAGFAAGLAAITRPEGVFLVFSRIILTRNWRTLPWFLLPFAAIQSIWLARNYRVFHGLVSNAYSSELTAGQHAGIGFMKNYMYVAGPVLIPGIILGVILCFRKPGMRAALAFLIPHAALHIWWWWNDQRFIILILPMLLAFAAAGYIRVIGNIRSRSLVFTGYAALPALLLLHTLRVGPPMFAEEIDRSKYYIEALGVLESDPDPVSVITGDPGLVFHNSRHPPTGSWHDQHLPPWEMLFKTYLTRDVRYLIYSNRYVSDQRFLPMISDTPVEHNYIIRCNSRMERYVLTVSPVNVIADSIRVFPPDYSRVFTTRRSETIPVTAIVYSLKLERRPMPAGTHMDAYFLEDETLCSSLDQIP